MSFKSQLQADLENVIFNIDEFADSSMYTPAGGGDPVSCSVLVNKDVLVQAQGYEAGVGTIGTTITAMVAEVGSPKKGAGFAVNDTTYTVQQQEENDGSIVTVVVR